MPSMSEKGQVVIPKAVREKTGIGAGEDLIVEARGREIVIRRPVDIFNYKPPRPRRDLGLTDRETTDLAWDDHVTEKFGNRRNA